MRTAGSAARAGKGVSGPVRRPAVLDFGLRDPDDGAYLPPAAAGGAHPTTGNGRDFPAPRYGPVGVRSPRAFLDQDPV
ncbi:MAG: hypothetical protein OXL68_06225 [Paracoccaceae bacterium]|nr:hypothetical protein [Paracoccaceae bacterium]